MNGRALQQECATRIAPAIIEIDCATKSFAVLGGQTFHALRDISLRVAQGEHIAVLGKSGSGKSTLLNLIAGLDRANAGAIRVAGADLRALPENAMARWRGCNVGVVFQFFQLLPTLTILENVVLAMELVGKVRSRLRASIGLNLLQRVGLADQAGKLPSMLSGGQQQRAAIARALANDPPILLADEPTGNLDTETAGEVNALFADLARQGKTLIVVTHDVSLAKTAHRIVRLCDGLVESEPTAVALQ